MDQRVRIKICGVRTPEIAELAAAAGADAIGLVFAPRSPRCVSVEEAARVAAAIPAYMHRVGVLANPDDRGVAEGGPERELAGLGLSAFQLHGRAQHTLPRLRPMRVLRAFAFEPETIAHRLMAYAQLAGEMDHLAGLVLDAPDPSQIGGGTGRSFDWRALREALNEARPPGRIILAGGLTPENVSEAIRIVRPWAVDVSSGVESRRGIKEPGRIRAFCQAVQDCDRDQSSSRT